MLPKLFVLTVMGSLSLVLAVLLAFSITPATAVETDFPPERPSKRAFTR